MWRSRAGTSDISRDSFGVSRPILRSLPWIMPSTTQNSRIGSPALFLASLPKVCETIPGRCSFSASLRKAKVAVVSITWASASIAAMARLR